MLFVFVKCVCVTNKQKKKKKKKKKHIAVLRRPELLRVAGLRRAPYFGAVNSNAMLSGSRTLNVAVTNVLDRFTGDPCRSSRCVAAASNSGLACHAEAQVVQANAVLVETVGRDRSQSDHARHRCRR